MSPALLRQYPEFQIRIPSTTANLGPGFDLFGMALQLYTTIHFAFQEDSSQHDLFDSAGVALPIAADKNLIAVGYRALLHEENRDGPGFRATVQSSLPAGRGFGSSAMALTAGVAAARHVLHCDGHGPAPLDTAEEDVQLLTRLEGHPDNVTPARVGGFVFACLHQGRVRYFKHRLPEDLGMAAIVPDFAISTRQSRAQLPAAVPVKDALRNMTGVLLWREYIDRGDPDLIIAALESDRLHQAYRAAQIPALDALQKRAAELGIYGATISGSGPGLMCFFPRSGEGPALAAIEQALVPVTEGHGQRFEIHSIRPDYAGLVVVSTALPHGG